MGRSLLVAARTRRSRRPATTYMHNHSNAMTQFVSPKKALASCSSTWGLETRVPPSFVILVFELVEQLGTEVTPRASGHGLLGRRQLNIAVEVCGFGCIRAIIMLSVAQRSVITGTKI